MTTSDPSRADGAGGSAEGSDRRAWGVAWLLVGLGVVGLVAATGADASQARSAADQDWSPFVLVAGLLLIGLVADRDGLFAAAGHRLAGVASSGAVLFVGVVITVGGVTAVLNLDTAVAFVTPVLVYTARSRGGGEAPLLYGCLMLANAGSLFLPGSNLTNLIVLGHVRLSGEQFLSHMWAPALAALVVTAGVVAVFEHRALRAHASQGSAPDRPVIGVGLLAVVLAAALVVVLRSPALPVAAVGVAAAGVRVLSGRIDAQRVANILDVRALLGLFGVAVALGTLGRAWSGPTMLLSHLDVWATAAVAALSTVVVNNLPAASLLAARAPTHPFALLIGLNIGPNLFVTGSLSWLLWLRAARSAGASPSIAVASRIGLVAVPLALASAVALLVVTGSQ